MTVLIYIESTIASILTISIDQLETIIYDEVLLSVANK